MTTPEPLSDLARALLAEERHATPSDADARARVEAQLSAALGPGFAAATTGATAGTAGQAAAPAKTIALSAAKLAGLVAVSLAVGAAAGIAADRALSPSSRSPAASPQANASVSAAPLAATAPPDSSAGGVSVSSLPSAPPSGAVSAKALPARVDPKSDLAAERVLLDAAHAGVSRSNASAALDAVERHAKAFPNGQLREEREAIWIVALVDLGRREEAMAHDRRFRASYPDSVFLPQIDAVLARPH